METQLPDAGGGGDIGLDEAGVVGSGTTKAEQASTDSPSLHELPPHPHSALPGLVAQANTLEKVLKSPVDSHAVACNSHPDPPIT